MMTIKRLGILVLMSCSLICYSQRINNSVGASDGSNIVLKNKSKSNKIVKRNKSLLPKNKGSVPPLSDSCSSVQPKNLLKNIIPDVRVVPPLPNSCMAAQPKALLKSIVTDDDVRALLNSGDWGQSQKSTKYWTVYSDRWNNTTYNGPSVSSGKLGSLDINEKVRIAEIKGDFALVYEERQIGVDFPHISESAVCRGWVPIQNLLLWSSCPTTGVGIYKKAFANSDAIEWLESPLGKTKYKKSYDDLLYIIKEEKGYLLLSREPKMEGFSDEVLVGWVKKSYVVKWNNRECLEPNWKPSVVENYANKKFTIYKDKNCTERFVDLYLGKENSITTSESTKFRLHPNEMRYPLLYVDNNVCEILVPATSANNPFNYTVKGFIPKNDLGVFWLPVVYMSSDEFAGFMEKLQPVMQATSEGNSDRKPYVAAMKALIRSMVPDITEREMGEKDVKEVMVLVAGLNGLSLPMKGRTLNQIQDENIVPAAEFDAMIAEFQNKYNKLKRIREQKYPFSITRNKITRYWIPLEDFP